MYQFKSDYSQRIYNTAKSAGFPDFLCACLVGQSKFETNNYTNSFVDAEKCFFSYMYSKTSKWQIAGGGKIADNKFPVAKYASLEDSVHEIIDWIRRRQKDGKFPSDLNTITTAGQYAKLLQDCGFYQGWAKYTKEQNRNFYTMGIQRGIDNLK